MMTLLAIDVGNSNIKYGHFVDGEMIQSWRHEVAADESRSAEIIGQVDAPVALASVVPSATEKIMAACKKFNRSVFSVSACSQKLITGMNETMGADRVAAAYAAYKSYGQCKRPVLLMGFGTATTLLAVTAAGHVAGGWIAPGINSTLEVLHSSCELLPLLKMEGQTEALGFDTESHMRNGVFLGHVGLVHEWLKSAAKQLASGSSGADVHPISIATGGWAQVIQEFEPTFDVVDEFLILKGVYLIATADVKTLDSARDK
jgi:type III pantothenate kinase